MLEVRGLSKSYQLKNRVTRTVLKDVSFDLEDGKLLACVGRNGSGKSTLIKHLCGVLHPTQGTVKIDGLEVYPNRTRLLRQIGVQFGQKSSLIWDLPLIESLRFYKEAYKLGNREFSEFLGLAQRYFGLERLLQHPVRKMSFGERVISDFCLTFLHSPHYLFLDEPTIGLDEITKSSLREFLRAYAIDHRATVLLSTHLLGDVESVADQLMILNDGAVQYFGEVAGFRQAYFRHKIVSVKYRSVKDDQAVLTLLQRCQVVNQTHDYLRIRIPSDLHSEILPLLFTCLDIIDVSVNDVPLNDVILEMYGQ